VEIAGAAVVAAAGFAGIFPRFEDGVVVRTVIAMTAGLLAVYVVRFSRRAETPFGAFVLALVLAAIGGVVTSIAGLFALSIEHLDTRNFGTGLAFSFILGAPTGLVYGAPLGILLAVTHRRAARPNLDDAERAASRAALWAILASALVIAMDVRFDSVVFLVPAGIVLVASAVAAAALDRAVRQRRRFLARVAQGDEPTLRFRAIGPQDSLSALPRITGAEAVLEWVPTAEDGAYRSAAHGQAVALVSRLWARSGRHSR
jgi:hypothetical protein